MLMKVFEGEFEGVFVDDKNPFKHIKPPIIEEIVKKYGLCH